MTKFALAAAAIFVSAGAAFADNPNASWNQLSQDYPTTVTTSGSHSASSIVSDETVRSGGVYTDEEKRTLFGN